MNIPAGALGAQAQAFINQYAGTSNSTSEIPVTIGIGGNYANPKTNLQMNEQKNQAKEAVKNAATEKGKEAIEKAVKGTGAESVVKDLLGTKKDTTKK